jgi:hypothetical protein
MAERRASWQLLLPTGILVAVAAYAWGRNSAPRASDAQRVAALESEVRGLRAAKGPAERLTAEEEQKARIAFWDQLGKRVDTEAADPAWRAETEPVIQRVIPAMLGPEVSVAEAKCAKSICRAKLEHPAWPRIPDDRFTAFVLNRESLKTMEIQLDTRTQGATTLYFLRSAPLPPKR